jgi:hypothetical protein
MQRMQIMEAKLVAVDGTNRVENMIINDWVDVQEGAISLFGNVVS